MRKRQESTVSGHASDFGVLGDLSHAALHGTHVVLNYGTIPKTADSMLRFLILSYGCHRKQLCITEGQRLLGVT